MIFDNSKPQFLTLTVVSFVKLFDEEPRRNIIVEALRFSQENRGLIIHAYVIMPSHVHMIVRAANGTVLWMILRDLKKYTSKLIVKSLLQETTAERRWPLEVFRGNCKHLKNHKEFKVWKEGYHAIDVSVQSVFYQKLDYIHRNPVKARLAARPEEFEFSSAKNYIGLSTVLEVTST